MSNKDSIFKPIHEPIHKPIHGHWENQQEDKNPVEQQRVIPANTNIGGSGGEGSDLLYFFFPVVVVLLIQGILRNYAAYEKVYSEVAGYYYYLLIYPFEQLNAFSKQSTVFHYFLRELSELNLLVQIIIMFIFFVLVLILYLWLLVVFSRVLNKTIFVKLKHTTFGTVSLIFLAPAIFILLYWFLSEFVLLFLFVYLLGYFFAMFLYIFDLIFDT